MDITTLQSIQTTISNLDFTQSSTPAIGIIGELFQQVLTSYISDQMKNASPDALTSMITAFSTARTQGAQSEQISH